MRKSPRPFLSRGPETRSRGAAFTLVELLVVILVLGILGSLVATGMARTRADTWAGMCRNQLRQIGVAVRLFQEDHNDMFPPAAVSFEWNMYHMPWDSFIHPYLGGRMTGDDMVNKTTPRQQAPKILHCPADVQPKTWWIGDPPDLGIRSYAMVGAGPNWLTQMYVDNKLRTYPLPEISLGVGIYWRDAGPWTTPDWNLKGYKSGVVRDPAGSFLIVEAPNKMGAAGIGWPCVSVGVSGFDKNSDIYQLYPGAVESGAPSNINNQGAFTYILHEFRFNYLFHDGHAAAFATNQTIGAGTLGNPKGMWTVAAGD